MYAEWQDGKTSVGGARKKSATLRTRKSLGSSKKDLKQDSDDEFRPATKSAPKSKNKEEDLKPRKRLAKLISPEFDGAVLVSASKDDASTIVPRNSKKGKEKESPKRKM